MKSDSQSFYSETGYERSVSSMYSASTLKIRRSTTQSSSSKNSSPGLLDLKMTSHEHFQTQSHQSNMQEFKDRVGRLFHLGHNVRHSLNCKKSRDFSSELNKNEYLGDGSGCCKYNKCNLL